MSLFPRGHSLEPAGRSCGADHPSPGETQAFFAHWRIRILGSSRKTSHNSQMPFSLTVRLVLHCTASRRKWQASQRGKKTPLSLTDHCRLTTSHSCTEKSGRVTLPSITPSRSVNWMTMPKPVSLAHWRTVTLTSCSNRMIRPTSWSLPLHEHSADECVGCQIGRIRGAQLCGQ